ncbi:hypothetical protein AHF37_10181 [Paragonimus kellicotti]|nr:hypothetical protein AHF37_10181 [Paragonimus kellicotti]
MLVDPKFTGRGPNAQGDDHRQPCDCAREEKDAAHSLKKAARVIATSPMAFQLRYLQTLCAISAEKNSTIFFPVPIDIMQQLGDFTRSSGGINSSQMWTNSEHSPEQTNNPESEQRGMVTQNETFGSTEDIDASSDTVIAATGEKDAAHSLKKAARVIATSPMAFQLRYLQTLCAISAEKNSTIFFPSNGVKLSFYQPSLGYTNITSM